MVSREEYKRYVNDLVAKDKNNENISYLSRKYSLKWGLMLAFGILSFMCGFCLTVIPEINLILGLFVLIIGVVSIVKSIIMACKSNKAQRYYKDNYRPLILDYLLKGYEYSFSSYDKIDERIFKDSQFGGYYEDYDGSDKLTINIPDDNGNKTDCYLTLCDLDVTKTEEDSDGDTRTVTVYSGVFGYVEFPFEFKCILSLDDCYRKSGVRMDKVKLEDIIFNKKLRVYSNDQIEARYILTPEMMEKLLYLDTVFRGLKITLVDNKMYIGATAADLFELNSIKNGDINTLFEYFYDEVKTILDIVNEIKDNNKIFKM